MPAGGCPPRNARLYTPIEEECPYIDSSARLNTAARFLCSISSQDSYLLPPPAYTEERSGSRTALVTPMPWSCCLDAVRAFRAWIIVLVAGDPPSPPSLYRRTRRVGVAGWRVR